MPDLLQNDIVSVTIDSRLDGQQILLCLHYAVQSIADPPGEVDLNTALDVFATELNAAGGLEELYANSLAQNVSIYWLILQKIHTIRYTHRRYTVAEPVGLITEDALTPNMAVVVTTQGEEAGRHNIGNLHIGGVPQTFVENGLVAAGAYAVYEALGAKLLEEYELDVDGTLVVMTPIIFNRVTPTDSPIRKFAYVQDTVRTMHRRTVGLGS